jgi:hypothetical protein
LFDQMFEGCDAGGQRLSARIKLLQAIRRGLLGTVAFVVDRAEIGSPLGLRRSLQDGLPVR